MVNITMSLEQERNIFESITLLLNKVDELEKTIKSEPSPSQDENIRILDYMSYQVNRIARNMPRHSIADVGWDSEDFHLRLGHVLDDPDHRVIILDYNEAEDTVGCFDLKYKGIAYFTADEVSPHNEYCRT